MSEPIRRAYSQEELTQKLTEWMLDLHGTSPTQMDDDSRDAWYRDSGLIAHFIRDHFPDQNQQTIQKR